MTTGGKTRAAGFDYVIVGGGTAGCVLATRLSQDPAARVLLLEAGPAGHGEAVTVPASWPALLGTSAEWGEMTVPQAEAGWLPYPRGRGLGGSGAVNAMAHIRGHQAVYNAWAAGGAAGWGFTDLLPFFKLSENAGPGRDPVLRGAAGPVQVAPVPEPSRHPVAVAFAGALTRLGFPVTGDLSGAGQEGVAWPDLAIAGGQRVSPFTAYLQPALARPNLTVRAGCRASRLIICGGRCTGVEYTPCDGTVERADADAEVIVCAGAVGSPHLLMLSGIGPADELRGHGITVAADLPATGAALQDHPVALTWCTSAAPLPASSFNHAETCASLTTPLAGDWADLQLFPILLPPPGTTTGAGQPDARFALAASVTAPRSRGSVRLASPDPAAAPLIDPGFLTDPGGADEERLLAGLGIIRRAVVGPVMARLGTAETWPGLAMRGSHGLRAAVRRSVSSYWHPAGTCAIGTVTDPQLRVHGIARLRVCDASVFPLIPNAPLHATVLAVAERAAALIAGIP